MASIGDWDKVQKSEEYWKYTPQERGIIKAQWFKENIASSQDFQKYEDNDKLAILYGFSEYGEDQAPDRTFWGTIGDVATSLAKGVVGLGEAAVGVANIPTMGLVGKGLESAGYDPEATHEFLAQGYSGAQRAASEKVNEAEGFLGTTKAMLQNPSTIAMAGVESAPLMLGGAGVSRGLIKAGLKAKKGLVALGAGEGTVSAGHAAENIRQNTEGGMLDPRQVASALGAGVGTGVLGAAGGRIAAKLGFADVDALLAGIGSKANKAGIAKRIFGGAISEGIFEELPQEAQEQIWINAALDKPLLEGVPEGAAQGMLVGAAMGAGANVVSRGRQAQPDTADVSPADKIRADLQSLE